MSMQGMNAYADSAISVTSLSAVSVEDFGFSDDEIKGADSMHVSALRSNVIYRYTGLDPVNTVGSEVGHVIYEGAERIIRGKTNITNFRLLALTTSARVHITLGTFGKIPNA